jgi:phenylalanyl-tRNA synthetase beta chain
VIADDAGRRVAGRHHGRRRHGGVRRHAPCLRRSRLLVARGRAGRSRRFNFTTDAGHRFERGVDPALTVEHIERITQVGCRHLRRRARADGRPDRVRVFEVGSVFLRDATVESTDSTVEGFRQPTRVAGVAYGAVDRVQWGQRSRNADFFDVKGDIEALIAPRRARFEPAEHPAMHPGRCARVLIDGAPVGHVGELHPRWRQIWEFPAAPLMFELELDSVLKREIPVFASVTRYQAVERDLAVVVPESVSHAETMAAVWAANTGGLLRDAVLFDIYRGKSGVAVDATTGYTAGLSSNEKSLTIRFRFNSDEATLTEPQIDSAMKNVMDVLASQLGARLRS